MLTVYKTYLMLKENQNWTLTYARTFFLSFFLAPTKEWTNVLLKFDIILHMLLYWLDLGWDHYVYISAYLTELLPLICQSYISAQYFRNMEFEKKKNAYALIVGIVGTVLNQIAQIYNLTLKSHSFVFVQYFKNE